MNQLEFEPSLVVPWNLNLKASEPFEYPFVAKYQTVVQSVTYLASFHSQDKESPTFQLLDKLFSTFNFDLLLVEGVPKAGGLNNPKVASWAQRQAAEGSFTGYETAYAISRAIPNNTHFSGCEPDEDFLKTKLVQLGYPIEQFYFFRFAQSSFQNQFSDKPKLSENFIEFMKNLNNVDDKSKHLLKILFDEWMKEGETDQIDLTQLEQRLMPDLHGTNSLSKISGQICLLRDVEILNNLSLFLKSYSAILLVCGGSHWSTQRLALENTLGSPVWIRNQI
jgi:hypothetical protein